jgi:phosphonate transport system substrate-binding protein
MSIRSTLQLGLIPFGSSPEALVRASAFATALGAVVGTPVEIHRAADYRVLVSALDQGMIDFAWLPPLSAARALRSGSANPAAIAVRNGTTSYLTGLLSMKSSPYASLDDLRGVRAAWVDRESASGYLVIRAALRAKGVSLIDAFREETFVRSHAEVARALRTGTADVGATCFNFVSGTVEIARSGYDDEGGLASDDVRILAYAGPIPSDIFAVHGSLGPKVTAAVQAALVDARPAHVHELAKELMHADGFARPTHEHMSMITSLYTTLDQPLTMPPPRSTQRP